VQVRKPGNIEDLYIDNSVDKPTLQERDVLIRVHAAAINRADTLQVYLYVNHHIILVNKLFNLRLHLNSFILSKQQLFLQQIFPYVLLVQNMSR